MKLTWVILAVFGVCYVHSGDVKAGDQLFEIAPATEEQLKLVNEALNEEEMNFDVWRPAHNLGDKVRVIVQAEFVDIVEEKLISEGIKYEIIDMDKLVEEEKKSMVFENALFAGQGFDYENYNSFGAITNELRRLASVYREASTFNVGSTYEGRNLVGLKISTGSSKPAVWIDGGIHAREWISPATVMYFTKMLLENKNKAEFRSLLSKYDFYILPVFNADGYEYSRSGGRSTRFWRKTRSPQGRCVGVDPNRNWDSEWSRQIGTSRNPCQDTYSGPRANSEKCVQVVIAYLTKLKNTVGLVSYFNVHAYSQLVLTPYSWTKTYPKDYAEIKRVADIFKDNVAKRYGTQYRVGPPPHLLYGVSGGSIDYCYDKLGVRYSYALELRDKGQYGFVLPTSQIKPSGLETTDAFVAALNAITDPSATAAPVKCVDTAAWCPSYRRYCYHPSIYEPCPLTCNKC